MRQRAVWKASLFLWVDQREDMADLIHRIRQATGYKMTYSQLVRACLDVLLPTLKAEEYEGLAHLVRDLGEKEAVPFVESWLVQNLRREVGDPRER